ncbi:Neural-cadherin, partial [Lucilia cuprina]
KCLKNLQRKKLKNKLSKSYDSKILEYENIKLNCLFFLEKDFFGSPPQKQTTTNNNVISNDNNTEMLPTQRLAVTVKRDLTKVFTSSPSLFCTTSLLSSSLSSCLPSSASSLGRLLLTSAFILLIINSQFEQVFTQEISKSQLTTLHATQPQQQHHNGLTAANAARMLAGSGGNSNNDMSLVLPHDTYPGFSIKRFKTKPVANLNTSSESGFPLSSSHSMAYQQHGSYHMLDNEYAKYFTVLEDGVVMTTSDISPLVNRPVNLVVVEETPNSTQTHNIQLYVMHRNDMLRFPGSMLDASGEVKENKPAGTRVRGVPLMQAFSNGELTTEPKKVKYSIIGGNEDGAFALQSRHAKQADERSTSLIIDGDDESGVWLVTNRPLDREQTAHYDLSVQASDLEDVDKTVSKIQITVLDENDNRPIFKAHDYKFAIAGQKSPELDTNSSTTWKRFSIVGKVEATDADGDKIAYRLKQPSNTVIIVPQTGEIMLVGQPPSTELLLDVEAHDLRYPSLVSSQPAKVLIEFLAPEPVSFIMQHLEHDAVNAHSHHREKRRVTRAVRPTKRIEFTEADGDTEGKSVFQLEKETDKETFKIRDENPWVTVETNGAVRVKKKWDYEELGPEKTIDFWVIITNTGHNAGLKYTDNQRVIIHVKDVNDEPPYFINRPLPMQAVVQLNAPPNTPVFTLQARDPDTDHNIHYFIVRDRTGGRFEVDERSGVVRTRGTDLFQLDMEYVLYVKAEDQNGKVDDRRFQSTPEERLSIVGDREIRYTLKAQSQGAGTFNIGPSSGIVKLAKELDFEDLRQPHVYSLIVTATEDSGGFSTSVELTIRVTDVNDNAPKFELPDYQAHNVDEDIPLGTSILRVKAMDSDSGANAEIEYLVSDDHFAVDSNGIIVNNKQLDADNNNAYYEFIVTAKDKGEPSKSGVATVRVYTKNKNDEEPKFSQQVYTPNVDENAGPNTLVTTVVASDKDGDNVRFGFVGGGTSSGQFVIEDITGVIRLHNKAITLDRDKYELNVTAMDDGSCCVNGDQTIHTSTAVVVVFITDVNDNKPVFKDCGTYYPKVEEGAPNGSPVIKVVATDEDKGVNGQVKYSIVQQPNQKGTKFTVDEETGEVSTNKVFDREGDDGKFVSVTVKATDQGEPSLEGVCSFTVEITDVNDNPPLFDRQKYVENVKQDASIGTNILRVSASDEDADNNGAIVYSLSAPFNPNDLEYFDIQAESGWIVLKKPLDRETYKLEAMAQDKGYPPLSRTVEVQIDVVDRANNPPVWDHTIYGPIYVKENMPNNGAQQLASEATVYIMLEDVNDEIPLFTEREQETVLEGEPIGTKVTQVYYYIVDSPRNEGKEFFEINLQSGEIFTKTVFDREKKGAYALEVEARDGAPSARPNSNGQPNSASRIRYEITSGNIGGAFAVKNMTGAIYVAGALDYETRRRPLDRDQPNGRPQWRFTVFAQDEGGEGLVGYADVQVNLKDINDNAPIFPQGVYFGNVTENGTAGMVVMTMTAVDYDDPNEGSNAKLVYSIEKNVIEEETGSPIFEIEPDTGVIKTAVCCLDRERTPDYSIQVVAMDGGGLKGTGTASIRVKDINDMPPQFTKDEWFTEVDETDGTTLPEMPILTVTVHDEDETNKFQYKVIDNSGYGADKFTMVRNNDGTGSLKIVQPLDYEDQLQSNDRQRQFAINQNGSVTIQRSLDREVVPRHQVKILAIDDGSPPKTATATLTVIVQDINDNAPKFLKDYRPVLPEHVPPRKVVEILATDDDDRSKSNGPPFQFRLDPSADDIIRASFKVYDRKHTQTDVPANVTVTVREIPHEAVINSGSVRLSGITDEDFIRVWNYRTQSLSRSKMDRFRDKLADLLNTDRENVDIFSVQLKKKHPPLTDVRFSAHGSPYYKPVRLNGIVLMNREEIEKDVGINITMVGIDECLYENQMCEGSCTNTLDISSLPYMVNANKTALVGVRVDTLAECTCGARNFSKPENCRNTPCYNGGRCVDTRFGPHCSCPVGYTGPRCQQTTRSFRGNGWAWYPPLEMCDDSHLSLEFITRKPDGLIIYNGPIVPPERDEMLISDFISLELERGYPRLLIDFGSGTLELRVKTKKTLDDGEWHRIDLFWDSENIRMVVDFCKSAEISEMEDGSLPEFDDMSCQARGNIPPFNEYLNVNAPLQVGGLYREQFDPSLYFWHYTPMAKGFDGCIRNLVHNSKLYDLAHPGLSRNSVAGCPQTEEVCAQSEQTARCWEHGNCVGSLSEARCQCRPGWTGPACNIPTIPTTFKQQSYVKYALSFEPDRFSTQIQLRFRTREQHGELFRVSDQHNREYGILEIKDARLHFRYNLNSLRTEEKDLWLNAVAVDDGQWHVVRINRYGSAATLELDGGEGRRYNETFEFVGHQWLLVDKQEGVYAGGKAEYTGVRTFEVYADYQKSCLDDIRLEDPVMTLMPGQEPNVGMFIEEHKKRADGDPNAPPFDDLRNYAYEGGGSTAGTDDECQEYDYLGAWGPRFDKLANMYGPDANNHTTDLELRNK